MILTHAVALQFDAQMATLDQKGAARLGVHPLQAVFWKQVMKPFDNQAW